MQSIRRKIYCDFCQKAGLPIFVHDWYLDMVCREGIWDFVLVEEEGEILGVLPYFLKKKFGFRYIAMPVGAKYMGPFLLPAKDNLTEQHLIYAKLIAQLPKVHSFRQNFDPRVSNWLPFYWEGFQQTTKYTYRLAIENLPETYQNFSKKTRAKIRKATKTLTIIDTLTAAQFHDIHQMTFDRQGLQTPLSKDKFLAFDKTLAEKKARKMFFAVDEAKNIHAVFYIILDKNIAYMHFLGSNPNFTKSEAVMLLYWHIFQYVNEKCGIHLIDFQGSMIKNVESLFRRFQAVQVPYFSIVKENSKVFSFIRGVK